jgi:hypothetical protein
MQEEGLDLERAPSDPAAECRKKGGVWDGKRCLSPAVA